MTIRSFHILKYIAGVTLLAGSWAVNANLITNGTFDDDLSAWTVATGTNTIPTRWVDGEAEVGAPGTNGISTFSQVFNIAAGTTSLSIDFDYLWEVNKPLNTDTFKAIFSYESTTGRIEQELLVETSDTALFGSVTSFSGLVRLNSLSNVLSNGSISFSLVETNARTGTRIALDNVNVQSVSEPSIIALLGLSLLGLGFTRRLKVQGA